MLWPVPLFGLPTYLVVALFALPNRRSPLIGATVAVVLLAAVINVKFDLAKDAASDAQGAIAYMFILVLGLPAAAIGGLVTWLGAAVLNRRPEITT